MLTRIFPRQIDNTYRGHWLSTWLFVPIVLLELVIGTNSIINTRSVATGADGIPLDSFSDAAAREVVVEFAILGLWRLLFGLLGVVALVRYRAMIPLIYLLLIAQQIGARAILMTHPAGTGTTQVGSIVVLVLLGLTLAGFVLSLLDRPGATTGNNQA
jgi:hypothetical protein